MFRASACIGLVLALLPGAAFGGATERVSVASGGLQANGPSDRPSMSADGRFVAFESTATNLVTGDTNGMGDVFVHDRTTGATSRVSVASDGTEANGDSRAPVLSADGRFIAFLSQATNLVPGDTNAVADVFVRDTVAGTTTRVSVASDGAEANGATCFNGLAGALSSSISADGRYVAFSSAASNLVPGDTNARCDAFVHDRMTGSTTRASVASDGTEANGDTVAVEISGNGTAVAFDSTATNLVPADTNQSVDVFVHDTTTGATTRVSVASGGTQGNGSSVYPKLSFNGHRVVFFSDASNLVAAGPGVLLLLLHDVDTGATTQVNVSSAGVPGNSIPGRATISADGGFAAFNDSADNLVPNDTNAYYPQYDVFLRDFSLQTTTRVSLTTNGSQMNGSAFGWPAISADNRFVAFQSESTDLVRGDANRIDDVFVHDRDANDVCGNGRVESGEQCDDGNAVDGDGCDSDCTYSVCAGGAEMIAPRLTLLEFDNATGVTRVTFTGRLRFPPGLPAVFDPSANGAQVSMEDLGRSAGATYDFSFRSTPIPPGAPGTGCDPRDGWTTRGVVHRYRNRSNSIDAPTCTAGSAGGLVSVSLVDRRATTGEIVFRVKGLHAILDYISTEHLVNQLVGPLRGTVVLGATRSESAGGDCGTYSFTGAQCTRDASGRKLTCK